MAAMEAVTKGPTWQWIVAILLAIAGAFGTVILNNVFGDRDKIVQLQIDISSIKSDLGYLKQGVEDLKARMQ